ncbi:MAG TPA: glycoside hydrolase family 2 protein [Propionibacteriaceae bacterium]|nr:glycoside hydrolase family 2 protein [Propionibacteriaceae bacterium]
MTADTPTPSRATRRTAITSTAGVTWSVAATRGPAAPEWASSPVPATVPGEVHTDLLTAGLIEDPFDGDNEAALAWIGRTDWVYRASFEWQPGPETRHDLVADGLDTVATVSLNGTEVARTANQHRGYRFDITSLLVQGRNELVVAFEAPVDSAERRSAELGDRPHVNAHPFNGLRKMASAYGWDWGPDLAGAGIWKWIGVESWSDVRLAAVRPLAGLDGTQGVLDVTVELEWAADASAGTGVRVQLEGTEATATAEVPPGQSAVTLQLRVPDVSPWWPRGHGEQALYGVSVELTDGQQLQQIWRGRVGFRNITLSTAPDARGGEFVLSVNDEPIYVKGANWIPDDALLTRLTAQTYRSSITDAVDAGMNLLRVWGGGIYESEDFYSACDELGMLVWQDFLFACAAYSEDEPLWSEVEAEARQAITRLSAHASLAVWNGNNENIWGYVEWGWRMRLGSLSWGDRYYTELLPALVAELDPRTAYTDGSPLSFAKYHHPNDPRHGTMHIWDVWNQIDYRHYRDYPARFVSEFGFQGPPAWSTLTSVVHDEPADPYGPQMLVHQKAADGNGKLERGLGQHLPHWDVLSPNDPVGMMDDWHWLTSLNQARAVAYGIEHFRSHYPLNFGSVVWQLNDNWPVISWAAVDGHGIRKPLWHALRRVYADRLVTVQPRTDEAGPAGAGAAMPTVIAHNDSPEAWTGELVVTRRSTLESGEALAEQRLPFYVEARSAVTVALDSDLAVAGDPRQEFLQVLAPDAAAAYWYFVEDTELRLPPVAEALEVTVSAREGGYRVTATAAGLVKDLALFPDRIDSAARVDSCLVTLLPGDSHTFEVTSAGPLDEVALTATPVLRSVNDVTAR